MINLAESRLETSILDVGPGHVVLQVVVGEQITVGILSAGQVASHQYLSTCRPQQYVYLAPLFKECERKRAAEHPG